MDSRNPKLTSTAKDPAVNKSQEVKHTKQEEVSKGNEATGEEVKDGATKPKGTYTAENVAYLKTLREPHKGKYAELLKKYGWKDGEEGASTEGGENVGEGKGGESSTGMGDLSEKAGESKKDL